jgi:hypothetical protein
MAQLEQETNTKKSFLFGLDKVFEKMSFKKPETSTLNSEDFPASTISTTNLQIKNLQKQEVQAQVLQQQEQANKFLNANLYELYFSMVKNGYQPTEDNTKKVEKHIDRLISSMFQQYEQPESKKSLFSDYEFTTTLKERNNIQCEHFKKLINYVESGYELSNEKAFQLLNNNMFKNFFWTESLFQPNSEVNTHPLRVNSLSLYTALQKVIFSDSFSNYAATQILKSVEPIQDYHGDDTLNIRDLHCLSTNLSTFPHIVLKNVPLNTFIDFMGKFNKQENIMYELFDYQSTYFNNMEKTFNKILKTFYSSDIQDSLNKTKEVYSDDYFQKKTLENLTLVSQTYKITALPTDIQKIIHDIKDSYSNLLNHQTTLTDDQKFTINNIYDKRVPEVLQKYFSIDIEYRTSLTNLEGKNAENLMKESLTNFCEKLNTIIVEVNENKLQDLSVSKRYSRTI